MPDENGGTIVPIELQIVCVERELTMRQRVYPRWTASGKMTVPKMNHELAAMRAVLETLKEAQRLGIGKVQGELL